MADILIPDAIQSLCGLPATMPANELGERLPRIVHTIGRHVEQGQREIAKSASLVRAAVEFVPNAGITRDETLPGPSADSDSVLDSCIPLGD